MATIRAVKNKDYVVATKILFEDPRLSFKAKGIAIYLLGKPDNWEANVTDLAKHSTTKRDAIYAGLEELINAGYMKKEQKRDSKGSFAGYNYILYETPRAAQLAQENSGLQPFPGFPETDHPFTDHPFTDKPTLISNDNIINNEVNNKTLLRSQKLAECEKMFEHLYKSYPRQKNKEQARKAFLKLKPDEDLYRCMLSALKAQEHERELLAKHGRPVEKKFIPYPATWLNARSWEDDVQTESEIKAETQHAKTKRRNAIDKPTETPLQRARRHREERAAASALLIDKGAVYDG